VKVLNSCEHKIEQANHGKFPVLTGWPNGEFICVYNVLLDIFHEIMHNRDIAINTVKQMAEDVLGREEKAWGFI